MNDMKIEVQVGDDFRELQPELVLVSRAIRDHIPGTVRVLDGYNRVIGVINKFTPVSLAGAFVDYVREVNGLDPEIIQTRHKED